VFADSLLDDIIEWDIPNWSTALAFWQQHSAKEMASVSALEIGSRNGGLSLGLALQGAQVVCTDLISPTDNSLDKHREYRVAHRISYAQIDALRIPYLDSLDVIVFKSVLGGIGRSGQIEKQAQALAQMYMALKPGGELWFAENLVASPMHQYLRSRWVRWGRDWRYVTTGEMDSFLSPFSTVLYQTVGFLGALGRTPRQRAVFGRLDRLGVERCVPKEWRYIIIGLARK